VQTLGAEQSGNAVEQIDLSGITADENLGQFLVLRLI
jgi:hypothetical protein